MARLKFKPFCLGGGVAEFSEFSRIMTNWQKCVLIFLHVRVKYLYVLCPISYTNMIEKDPTITHIEGDSIALLAYLFLV